MARLLHPRLQHDDDEYVTVCKAYKFAGDSNGVNDDIE